MLNKADLLPADELERVREYVATNAAAALGAQPEVLAVSAKAALALKAAASASSSARRSAAAPTPRSGRRSSGACSACCAPAG